MGGSRWPAGPNEEARAPHPDTRPLIRSLRDHLLPSRGRRESAWCEKPHVALGAINHAFADASHKERTRMSKPSKAEILAYVAEMAMQLAAMCEIHDRVVAALLRLAARAALAPETL